MIVSNILYIQIVLSLHNTLCMTNVSAAMNTIRTLCLGLRVSLRKYQIHYNTCTGQTLRIIREAPNTTRKKEGESPITFFFNSHDTPFRCCSAGGILPV